MKGRKEWFYTINERIESKKRQVKIYSGWWGRKRLKEATKNEKDLNEYFEWAENYNNNNNNNNNNNRPKKTKKYKVISERER